MGELRRGGHGTSPQQPGARWVTVVVVHIPPLPWCLCPATQSVTFIPQRIFKCRLYYITLDYKGGPPYTLFSSCCVAVANPRVFFLLLYSILIILDRNIVLILVDIIYSGDGEMRGNNSRISSIYDSTNMPTSSYRLLDVHRGVRERAYHNHWSPIAAVLLL